MSYIFLQTVACPKMKVWENVPDIPILYKIFLLAHPFMCHVPVQIILPLINPSMERL
jgi:hypothetical protein